MSQIDEVASESVGGFHKPFLVGLAEIEKEDPLTRQKQRIRGEMFPDRAAKRKRGDQGDHGLYEYATGLARHDSGQNETRQMKKAYSNHLLGYPTPVFQRRNRGRRGVHLRIQLVPDLHPSLAYVGVHVLLG